MITLLRLLRPIKGKRRPPHFYRWSFWTKLIGEIRVERNWQCECCRGPGHQGHHWIYPPEGKEKRKHIILLCDTCHWCVHYRRWLIPLRFILGHMLHKKNAPLE